MMIIVVISFAATSHIISRAEEADSGSSDSTSSSEDPSTTYDCLEILLPYLTDADAEFAELLGSSVTSEEPSSEIVDLMIEKYKEYLANIETTFDEATAPQESQQISEVTERLGTCQSKVEEHIEANEQIMQAEITSSCYAKKTTALLDEYKWINERLRDMQETVGYIGGYLTTVDGQLSGFTKTCVKQ